MYPAGHVKLSTHIGPPVVLPVGWQQLVKSTPAGPQIVHGHAVQPVACTAGRQPAPPPPNAMQISPAAQTLPQPPQLNGSVFVLTQPPLQVRVPVGHVVVVVQAVPMQRCAAVHIVPHVPQSALLTLLTHAPPGPHAAPPAAQEHVPPEQTSPSLQGAPQPPQFNGSVIVSVQAFVPPPIGHDVVLPGQAQVLAVHVSPAAQRLPHMPQLRGSVVRSAHVPKPHITPGAGQVQAPLMHVPPVPQRRPQPPQLLASVETSTQVPPQLMPEPGQMQTPPVHVAPVAQR